MAGSSGNDRWRAITYRRAEVLSRVCDGLTDSEIARDLGISIATVRSLLSDLMMLAGAGDRRELARWWRTHSSEWLVALARAGGVDCAELARRWLQGELRGREQAESGREPPTLRGRNHP